VFQLAVSPVTGQGNLKVNMKVKILRGYPASPCVLVLLLSRCSFVVGSVSSWFSAVSQTECGRGECSWR
jgi:hypothetical protein